MDEKSRLIQEAVGKLLTVKRSSENRNAHLAQDFDAGEPIPGTRCMREGCDEERWRHPTTGELVLCREHAADVVRGVAKAPPLRRNIDYTAVGRKTFFVDFPQDPPPAIVDDHRPTEEAVNDYLQKKWGGLLNPKDKP